MSRVWVYTIVRDESLLIRFWLRYYQTFCERLIVYDDQSTDGTREIVSASSAELRDCPWSGLDDIKGLVFASTQYKEARNKADWVIWVDVDEFIYHKDIANYLEKLYEYEITLPKVEGYSMYANNPPSSDGQIYDEIKTGIPDGSYSKQCVFSPEIDITWTPGRHVATSNQAVINAGEPLKLLHYRHLGVDWHIARNNRNYNRLTQDGKLANMGIETHPGAAVHHNPAWYAERISQAYDCISDE